MRRGIYIVSGVVIFLTLASISQAQIHRLTVTVKGMSCPFCAYGVEKKLKKVKGVESITVNMKEGTATLSAQKGASININQVPEAVKESGFTPGRIRIIAIGNIVKDENQRLFLKFNGLKQSLRLINIKKDIIKQTLLSSAGTAKLIEIKGIAREQQHGKWTFSPEIVKKVSK